MRELETYHTVGRITNDHACAVAPAKRDVLEEEALVARVGELIPRLQAALVPLSFHPHVTELRSGTGLMAGLELASKAPVDQIAPRCIEHVGLFRIMTGNTVQISPPFIIDDGDLGRIAGALNSALDAVEA